MAKNSIDIMSVPVCMYPHKCVYGHMIKCVSLYVCTGSFLFYMRLPGVNDSPLH